MKKYTGATLRWNQNGFSLVELLIAMSILAVITAAIFSLYNNQYRVTHIESDVVDVQQNLKTALDSFTRDARMAGFMVTGGTSPITSAIANSVVFTTASSSGDAARIDVSLSANVTSGTAITFTVASPGQLASFDPGNIVRIVDPGEKNQPVNAYYTVSAKDITVPSVTLNPNGTATNVTFKRGFLIVKTAPGTSDTFPNTVQYCVGPAAGCAPAVTTCPAGQNCLMRIVNGAPDNDSVVSTNIQALQFSYLLDDGTEAAAPADPSLVRSLRVSITGQTVDTAGLSGGAKTRTVTTIAKIRNK